MYVANYIPEPEAMPGNVTQERYRIRLRFLRTVYAHLLVAVGVAGIAENAAKGAVKPDAKWIATLLIVLVLCSLVRTFGRGKAWEPKLGLPLLFMVVAAAIPASLSALASGWPLWSPIVGLFTFGLYMALCGRDFSFVGGYVLSLIVSSTLIAIVLVVESAPTSRSITALLSNTAVLGYVAYDLAALLSRRKVGEEHAATLDLFRDIFNLAGWVPRVVMHWYRHRILNDLSFDLPFRRSETD